MPAGATHAFDRTQPEITIVDPFSQLGVGDEVIFRCKKAATTTARDAAVVFSKANP